MLLPDERLNVVNENIRLIEKKNGLTFGTDAYLLSAFANAHKREDAVDLGSGTGILTLLLLAKNKVRSITAVEIQPTFADLIGRNAKINGMDGKIRIFCGDVRDFPDTDTGKKQVGVVIANPPYMRRGSGRTCPDNEREIARREINGGIGDFCGTAGRILKTGGHFYVVWKTERLRELFTSLSSAKLEPKRMTFVHADENHEPCMVLVDAVKDGKADIRITPPLFLYEKETSGVKSQRILTDRAREIYSTCEWFC